MNQEEKVKTTLRDVMENVPHRYPGTIVIFRSRKLYDVKLKDGDMWVIDYADNTMDANVGAGGEEATIYVEERMLNGVKQQRDENVAALEASILMQQSRINTMSELIGYMSLALEYAHDFIKNQNVQRGIKAAILRYQNWSGANNAPPEGYIALSDTEIEAAEEEDRMFQTCIQCGELTGDCQCDD
jgi:hypothetical protein